MESEGVRAADSLPFNHSKLSWPVRFLQAGWPGAIEGENPLDSSCWMNRMAKEATHRSCDEGSGNPPSGLNPARLRGETGPPNRKMGK